MNVVSVLAAAVLSAALSAPAATSAAAPADEYFGPLRMSAIGIRMRVDVLGRRFHARTIADDDLLHDAGDAEVALRAWHDRYPRDPWLPPASFHLEQLYQAVQTAQARARATAMLHYVIDNFPRSPYASSSRARLAQGFPPLHAESAVRATAAPYASPSAGSADGSSAAPAAATESPAPPSTSASPGVRGDDANRGEVPETRNRPHDFP